MNQEKTYLVTRHPGAVAWAEQQGLTHVEHITHLDVSIIEPQDIVIGSLPVNIAAQIIAKGAHYGHLALDVPESERGKELTADDMDRFGARIEWFSVSSIPNPQKSNHEHVLYQGALTDWNADEIENPQSASVKVEHYGSTNLTVTIANGDENEPALVLVAEIDKGVPTVHIAPRIYDVNALHIRSGVEGLYITPEIDDSLKKASKCELTANLSGSFYIPAIQEPDNSPSL